MRLPDGPLDFGICAHEKGASAVTGLVKAVADGGHPKHVLPPQHVMCPVMFLVIPSHWLHNFICCFREDTYSTLNPQYGAKNW